MEGKGVFGSKRAWCPHCGCKTYVYKGRLLGWRCTSCGFPTQPSIQ